MITSRLFQTETILGRQIRYDPNVEANLGKGRKLLNGGKYWLPAFSPYSTNFSKAFIVKTQECAWYNCRWHFLPHNPDFSNDPDEGGFRKHFGKRENAGSFSHNVFYHS